MMKRVLIIVAFLVSITSYGQEPIYGVWQAIDEDDGTTHSLIEVFEEDGKVHGKVINLKEELEDFTCSKCPGEKRGKPVLGLEIIWDMKKNGDVWKGGRVLDPEEGKKYKCRMKVKGDVLEVRGYVGVPAFGRTKKLYRVKAAIPGLNADDASQKQYTSRVSYGKE